jgi:5-amino-6-(5-phosphoribosylamino)uracil reductase
LPGKDPSPARVIGELRKRGLRKLILEGGGEVHFAFAKAGLVDEWYITITPRLIGGRNAPSFLDGEGFIKRDHIELKLVSEKRVGDELFLRYRRKR